MKKIIELTEEEVNYLESHLSDYKEEIHCVPKFTGKLQKIYVKDSVNMIDEILKKMKIGAWKR